MDRNEQAREIVQREIARQTLAGFLFYTFPEYEMGWVHEEICQKLDDFLDAVQRKESPRLMLMMPPRHGKSEIVSRRFPAYALGKYPDMNIIATSYSAGLAGRNNRDAQRIIDAEQYATIFPDTRLMAKGVQTEGTYKRTSEMFEVVDHQGAYRSAGVGGGITGMGGDILIVDDPFKDRQEADSATIRDKVYDWYTSTLYTRLSPGGGILIIQTRWHTDDLCGRLLQNMQAGDGDQWEVIEYPAIATRDEKHRKIGEALHPERYSIEALEKIKAAVGSRDWAALYQQQPTIDGGAIFKREWLKFYTRLPERIDNMLVSWDLAFKDADNNDFVVGQVWARAGADMYLVDQVRGHWSFTQTIEEFLKLADRYPKALTKLVEDKANGPAVIDTLKHKVMGIKPITPKDSKTARAYSVTPLFEAGNVYIPEPTMYRWVNDYITELLQFPVVAHDDQVDATTQALNEMRIHYKRRINPMLLRRAI